LDEGVGEGEVEARSEWSLELARGVEEDDDDVELAAEVFAANIG